MYNISQKYFSRLVFFAKILIIAGAYYIISAKILDRGNFNTHLLIDQFSSFDFLTYPFMLLLMLLSLVNWVLEILKWQSLVQFIKLISFSKATSQSLSSLTASLITPNRIGEYGAKAIYYPKPERAKIMLLNFLGNFTQMGVTVFFGSFGLLLLWEYLPAFRPPSSTLIWYGFALTLLIAGTVLLKKKWEGWYRTLKRQFLKIPYKIHSRTVIYSILRYLVFSHQFYFFLLFFGVEIQYTTAMPIIFSMYFISSVIPGFVIFDWLVKGSVAIYLFGLFGINEIIVLSITSLMWISNFAIPSIAGMIFVLTFDGSSLKLKQSEVLE